MFSAKLRAGYFGAAAAKWRKRDQKWQEREERVVNLQTVGFFRSIPRLSYESRANIMVSCAVGVLTGRNHNIQCIQVNVIVTERIESEPPGPGAHVQADHRMSSHFLTTSHMVGHVGHHTVLPCFSEVFPSSLHVVLGT